MPPWNEITKESVERLCVVCETALEHLESSVAIQESLSNQVRELKDRISMLERNAKCRIDPHPGAGDVEDDIWVSTPCPKCRNRFSLDTKATGITCLCPYCGITIALVCSKCGDAKSVLTGDPPVCISGCETPEQETKK